MAEHRDRDAMTGQVIELAGGSASLSNVNHCATRPCLNVIDTKGIGKVVLARIDAARECMADELRAL